MRLHAFAAACFFSQLVIALNQAPAGAAAQAILVDGDGPWRDDNWRRAAAEFRSLLTDAGYRVRVAPPPRLAMELAARDAALVAAPSLERLPLEAFKAIAAHSSRGGSLLAGGGEPFREPLHQTSTGEWITVKEALARAPRRVIVEPVSARLIRAAAPPEGAFSQAVVAGPGGVRDSLEVKIANPVRIDPLEAAFPESPFQQGETTTIVTVRGTIEENLLVQWSEEDGTRWWARVPLAPEWRTHVLRPTDFSSPPAGGGAAAARRAFDPRLARKLAFGLAAEVNTPVTAPAEFAIAPIAAGAAPEIEDFAAPVIETISPWYKQYDAVRQGRPVRVPVARQRGLTAATENEGRYEAIGDLLSPAASRFITAKGASLFWVPWPELRAQDRARLLERLREAQHRLALLNGGAREFAILPDEPVGLGARVLNASRSAVTANVVWTVRQGDRRIGERRASVPLAPAETRDVNADALPPLAPGEYTVETQVQLETTTCDRIGGRLRVVDPDASRASGERLRVENGHFTAGGNRVFLNGVNYWPRNVAGLEAPRYWDHWLTARNYDPDVVEADLAALEALGFNLVSIQYNRLEQSRALLDFVERCGKHGIWVHLSIGSASNLRLNPQRDEALLKRAQLPGRKAVFGYELAWEPHFGAHNARVAFDERWRAWVLEQYGSLAAAEEAWSMPGPRDAKGELTNPSDEQIATDGAHRVMVAAYRRFLDDIVSRTYGRAVRGLRALDPDALIAVRSGWGGTGQRGNNIGMGYDLAAGAAHLDAVSPEGYGMPATFAEARRTGFVTAYGRWAGNGKPVLWLEFGASIGPRDGTNRTRRNQALLCETTMRMIADSGADGTAVWWFPGGWRFNERSDFGIMNPDGSPRESARVISEWARKLNGGASEPAEAVVIEIDRDADARGLHGMWAQLGDDYVKAREAGRPVRLATKGSGTDTANMPLLQVGNVPYKGSGPLKYANAEIAGIRVSWDGGEARVENGAEVEAPPNTDVEIAISLVNTGEATWISTGDGACSLRTNRGDAAIRAGVPRHAQAAAAPLRVKVGRDPIDITGRVEAAGRGSFGEPVRLRIRPRTLTSAPAR